LDRFAPFELLLAIADAGNIGRAAKALGMSNAATSRFLAALEECLGAQLVRRNTRCLYLTDEGAKFAAQALFRSDPILADIAGSEAAVNATALSPSGTLRVSASLSFALQHIAPCLPEYTRRYPNVRVHVVA
jgi:DNA-binding transcriptional LysR family regulator